MVPQMAATSAQHECQHGLVDHGNNGGDDSSDSTGLSLETVGSGGGDDNRSGCSALDASGSSSRQDRDSGVRCRVEDGGGSRRRGGSS